jgi:hypothetical protein
VIYNICQTANYYDDEFVTQFNAIRIKEPEIQPYPKEIRDKSIELFKFYIQECIDYVAYFEEKRMAAFAWDAYSMFFRKLEYCIKPKGAVSNMIGKGIDILTDRNKSLMDANTGAKKIVSQLNELSAERLAADLYYSEEFVSWKYYGKLERIQEQIKESHEIASKEFNKGEYIACVCTIALCYYRILSDYKLTPEIQKFVEFNLEQAAEKPWKEAAELLFQSLDNFMEGNLLVAMGDNNFDSDSFVKAFGEGDVKNYVQQAMEMSKKVMSKIFTSTLGK